MQTKENLKVAAVTGKLDWSQRVECSHERYDPVRARQIIATHVEGNLRRMRDAVRGGARLIVGQEYFTAVELFNIAPPEKETLLTEVNPPVLRALRQLAGEHAVWLACAFMVAHPEGVVETGVLAHPDGETISMQIKNTAIACAAPLPRGYRLFDIGFARAGLFTCSDCTSYPEDCLALAKDGMQIMLLPGCGFSGADWFHYLKVRSQDLGCVIIYADEHRAAIVDAYGRVAARTDRADDMISAKVMIEPKPPVTRLRSTNGIRPPGPGTI